MLPIVLIFFHPLQETQTFLLRLLVPELLVALFDVDIADFEQRIDEQGSPDINPFVHPLVLQLVFFYLLHPIQVPYLLV
jgi:hypothetical protein